MGHQFTPISYFRIFAVEIWPTVPVSDTSATLNGPLEANSWEGFRLIRAWFTSFGANLVCRPSFGPHKTCESKRKRNPNLEKTDKHRHISYSERKLRWGVGSRQQLEQNIRNNVDECLWNGVFEDALAGKAILSGRLSRGTDLTLDTVKVSRCNWDRVPSINSGAFKERHVFKIFQCDLFEYLKYPEC